MHDSIRNAPGAGRLAFQEITIEDLNKTVTAHEIEMAKIWEHMRLMIEKLKATQPPISPPRRKKRHRRTIEGKKRAFCRLRAEAQRLVAAQPPWPAAFTMVVTMIVAVAAEQPS
ncbi:Protein SlyX [Klebsiella pneumoniae]|nr:Protein SlyX [Klebsiella pneumoniae]